MARRARCGGGRMSARSARSICSTGCSDHALSVGVESARARITPYRNTIGVEQQPPYPGDLDIEERLTAVHALERARDGRAREPRVRRARRAYCELCVGGRDLSKSASTISSVPGADGHGGDLVYFPAALGARRLCARLSRRPPRRRASAPLSPRDRAGRACRSYPHPWLMPDFWQFPTGSMGIGPINSIYQARFMRYLAESRPATATDATRLGRLRRRRDGRAGIARRAFACRAREARQSDLHHQLQPAAPRRPRARQRADHPGARGAVHRRRLERDQGAVGLGLGRALRARPNHALLRRFAQTVDGQYPDPRRERRRVQPRAFLRARSRAARARLAHVRSSEIDRCERGGHDFRKLYAAFAAALRTARVSRP